jgi:hypothetical protein
MRINRFACRLLVVVCCGFLSVAANSATDSSEVGDLLSRAEALLWLGVVDKGASRSFVEARDLLESASARLTETDLSPDETRRLTLELESVQENIEILTELYEERFYGVFPLARLITPTLLADEGFAFTEQLFHPPDVAAVEVATRRLLNQIDNYHHPHVVITSLPADRRLENVAWELLHRDGRSTPLARRALVAALGAEDLDAIDRGEIDSQLVARILAAVDAVNLIVLTVSQPVELDDVSVRLLRGDYYIPHRVIKGGLAGASFSFRSESFEYMGFARDRKDQYWSIYGTQLLLFAFALVWSAGVSWSIEKRLKIVYRLAIGTVLFVFGNFFITVAVTFLRRVVPDPSAMASAAWWWPALLGLLAILGGGLVAWFGQARLTNILPGARGARAVGVMFALVALGASSYFVAPLLLLDESHGLYNLVPFVLTSVCLAVLFGYAARTGPPVPHYFMIGPLLLAPMAGVCLLMATPGLLWAVAGMTAALCLTALIRHRVALAHDTEEPEPSPAEAAQADQQKLNKLAQKLNRGR